jgi:hypothetical protein
MTAPLPEDDELSLASVTRWAVPWEEDAVRERDRFAAGLRELGLQEDLVQRDLASWDEEVAGALTGPSYLDTPGVHGNWGADPDLYEQLLMEEHERKRSRALDGLRRILGVREVRVLESTTRAQRLPLFVLSSPPVAGSSVSYTNSLSRARSAAWSVEVLGTGTGMDVTLSLAGRGTFVARNGDRKLVFLPATIHVSRVGVYERGRQVGEGLRTQVRRTKEQIGVERLRSAAELQYDGQAPFVYPLAGDPSGDIATIEFEGSLVETFEFELGVEAFNLGAKLHAKVTQEHSSLIKLELPSGIDYEFRALQRPTGLWCVSPPRPS